MLIELSSNADLGELETKLFENIYEQVDFDECVIGNSESEMRNLWRIREEIAIACGMGSPNNHVETYDFSLDSNRWLKFKDWLAKQV